jgi:protein TonB
MAKEKKFIPKFDDIVFEKRNQEYGAFRLRKKYNRNVLIAMLIGILIIGTAVITPYLNAKALENQKRREQKLVEIKMENLDQPQENIAPPPPPPPPPAETVAPIRYVAPVVVDTVKPEDIKVMTADQAQVETKNEEVQVVEQIQQEVIQEEIPVQIFYVVEEMPAFPGGDGALLTFINSNIVYPDIARENNIQGKVILKFCVTYKGTIDQIEVVKPMDKALEEEAMRVIKLLPPWKPGKQGGKPVNVWFTVPVIFQLK